MAKLRLGVLVSGNGSNLQAIIDAIADGRLDAEIRIVISNEPGVRALHRAELAGIPALVVPHRGLSSRSEFDARLMEALEHAGAEWVVLAGFMRLLTPAFLQQFTNRVLNIHPALLPAFPGTHAIRQALEYGVKVTGCTVHLVDEGIDSGPILAQRAIAVLPDDDETSLAARMHAAEHELYVQALQKLATEALVLTPGAGRTIASLGPK